MIYIITSHNYTYKMVLSMFGKNIACIETDASEPIDILNVLVSEKSETNETKMTKR